MTTDPRTREAIIAALAARSRELLEAVRTLTDDQMLAGQTEHWGPAQHLAHLTAGHRRVTAALHAHTVLPAAPPGASRGYDAVRDAYLTALAALPAPMLARNARSGAVTGDPAEVVAAYEHATSQLRAAAAAWSEAELDAHAMVHPLLGPLRVREMLEFMLYHDLHHLEGLRRSVKG